MATNKTPLPKRPIPQRKPTVIKDKVSIQKSDVGEILGDEALTVFCYFDNGTALKMVATDYVAQSGEQLFYAEQTQAQLIAAFPDYPQSDVLCYYGNGMAFRWVPANYSPISGEVIFASTPSGAQLTAAFQGYTSAAAEETAIQLCAETMAAGIELTSTSTAALNGVYSIGPADQALINAIVTYILLNNIFPANASTFPWADIDGDIHVFPSVAIFKNFATAVADFVAAVAIYDVSGGTSGSIPSNAITIP